MGVGGVAGLGYFRSPKFEVLDFCQKTNFICAKSWELFSVNKF